MTRLRMMLDRWAVPVLIRLACVVALSALGLTVGSIVYPRPLLVMAASSIGQMLSLVALGLYALAVLADSLRSEKREAVPPAVDESP